VFDFYREVGAEEMKNALICACVLLLIFAAVTHYGAVILVVGMMVGVIVLMFKWLSRTIRIAELKAAGEYVWTPSVLDQAYAFIDRIAREVSSIVRKFFVPIRKAFNKGVRVTFKIAMALALLWALIAVVKWMWFHS
jgi:hypothetical protein